MRSISEEKNNIEEDLSDVGMAVRALLETVSEPLLVLDGSYKVLACNEAYSKSFDPRSEVMGLQINLLERDSDWGRIYDVLVSNGNCIKDYPISFSVETGAADIFITANPVDKGLASEMVYISFRKTVPEASTLFSIDRNFQDILAHVPAIICVLKGPEHIFDVANDGYLQLIGRKNILGKPIRDVLPEVENQGFFKILDSVYASGQPYMGTEVPVDLVTANGKTKKSFLDFLYQPTRNSEGKVDGIFVHAVDVSGNVIARNKLEESRERYRILVESMPAIVWMSHKNGETALLNKNWYKFTGQTRKEASEWGWLSAVDPLHLNMMKEVCNKAHKTQKGFSVSFRLYHQSGEYRWVLNTGEPRFDPHGNFEGMIGTILDAHEEKIQEQQLKEKEHRLRSIVEEATVATAVYIGEEMRIELANEAMINLWGKDSSVIGKTLEEAIPELEGQPFNSLLKEVYSTGEIYWGKEDKVDLVINGERQSGFFNFTYKPLRDERGDIYGILNMALDVTETVESKLLLKESELHFRQMADLMPEKVANITPDGQFIYFNQNWLHYTGMSSEQLQETGWAQFIHPDERKDFEENWRNSLQTGEDFEMELRFLDRYGKYKWHLSRAEAVRDEKGRIKMWIGNNTEIQKLKEEEKRKEEFLKMVSHELKTPVTSIKGYVQLLLKVLQDEKSENISGLPVRPSLERIDHQIQRLTRLISEMLDISRIEENKLQLQKSAFDLNQLVDETIQDILYTNTQHKIIVQHKSRKRIFGDRDRIGQVLINLITNAIKYSPEKPEVQVLVFSPKEGQVSVSVKDEGIGIDPQKHKYIFQRFFRAEGKSEETFSGFGIGLYLAKEIIQRHKGEIEVNSEIGEGAEFIFTLATI